MLKSLLFGLLHTVSPPSFADDFDIAASFFNVIQLTHMEVLCGENQVPSPNVPAYLFSTEEMIVMERNPGSPAASRRFPPGVDPVRSVCWLRSNEFLPGIQRSESLKVVFGDGTERLYAISAFSLDQQQSRLYGVTLNKAYIREEVGGQILIAPVYRVYSQFSSRSLEDRPDQLFGSLPTGQRFQIKMEPQAAPLNASASEL